MHIVLLIKNVRNQLMQSYQIRLWYFKLQVRLDLLDNPDVL